MRNLAAIGCRKAQERALGPEPIAVYFGAWASRSFFVVNPDPQMRDAVAEWASRWPKLEVFDAHF